MNNQWSDWIDWAGGECPLPPGTFVETEYRDGTINDGLANRYRWNFADTNDMDCPLCEDCDIIAYRYKIEEPEMHPDLEWLARNVSEWPTFGGRTEPEFIYKFYDLDDKPVVGRQHPTDAMDGAEYSKAQWQAARQQLGLDQPEVTEEEEEAWREKAVFSGTPAELMDSLGLPKQARYQDAKGEDWIDEFARTATAEEFRGAMRFTIGKYNRRAGKKDELVKEIEKMRDYCGRWLEYERGLK